MLEKQKDREAELVASHEGLIKELEEKLRKEKQTLLLEMEGLRKDKEQQGTEIQELRKEREQQGTEIEREECVYDEERLVTGCCRRLIIPKQVNNSDNRLEEIERPP